MRIALREQMLAWFPQCRPAAEDQREEFALVITETVLRIVVAVPSLKTQRQCAEINGGQVRIHRVAPLQQKIEALEEFLARRVTLKQPAFEQHPSRAALPVFVEKDLIGQGGHHKLGLQVNLARKSAAAADRPFFQSAQQPQQAVPFGALGRRGCLPVRRYIQKTARRPLFLAPPLPLKTPEPLEH